MKQFTVKGPATSANLGPGYDVIGVALEIFNEFHVKVGGENPLEIRIEGEGSEEIPENEDNLVYQSLKDGFQRADASIPNLNIRQVNRIPIKRGMGSSATAALGGVMIAKTILGDKLSIDDMLDIAIKKEGHPDNLFAAYMGGVTINYLQDGKYKGINFLPLDPLNAVLAIPEIYVSTQHARKILPEYYPIEDVVFNIRNVSLLMLALKTGNYSLLREATKDKIHQIYRAQLIPGFYEVCQAAQDAGSLCEAISGSGSTVISLCCGNERDVAEAMSETFCKMNIRCRTRITGISEKGAYVEECR
jgi:homoserine kinase